MLPDGFSSLGTNFCMSAWPNSQPGGKLFEKFEHYFRMTRSQSVKWEIKKQNKSKTNLLGVHKDRSTVLSHTREQYSWLSLPRTLKPNWDPHWLTEMALISLYWDKKKKQQAFRQTSSRKPAWNHFWIYTSLVLHRSTILYLQSWNIYWWQ